MKTPTETVPLEIGELTLNLRWDKGAVYRLSREGFQDYDPESSFAFLCTLIWAMATGPAAKRLRPEDIAENLPEDEKELERVMTAVTEAQGRATAPGKTKRKGSGSGASSG